MNAASKCVLVLAVALPLAGFEPIEAQDNSWTNPASSKWETPSNWSLGVAPTNTQSIFITNAASKTVTIDATTSGIFSNTMTIDSLVIRAPAGAVNTLALLNSGTTTPLNVLQNSFIGNLTVSNGMFFPRELFIGNPTQTDVGTLTVAGGLVALPGSFNGMIVGGNGGTGTVWQTGGQIVTTNTDISIGGLFSPAVGQMTVSNGTLLTGRVFVGGQGDGNGTFTIAGGTNIVANNLRVGPTTSATGTVWLTGGLLVSSNGTTFIGDAGVGSMTVSNGAGLINSFVVANNFSGRGTFTLAGGTVRVGSFGLAIASAVTATGAVWITGGTLVSTNAEAASGNLIVGFGGTGRLTLSNGTINAGTVRVAPLAASPGTLTVAGGTFTAERLEAVNSSSSVNFFGGVTTLHGADVHTGQGFLNVGGPGQTAVLDLPAGTNRFDDTFIVAFETNATGKVFVKGGDLVTTNNVNTIAVRGTGTVVVSNGAWRARTILVGEGPGSAGLVHVAGGNCTLQGLLSLGDDNPAATGAVFVTGGQLLVTNNITSIGTFGIGNMTVSNGTWRARDVEVGLFDGSHGALTVAGGTNTLAGSLALGIDTNGTGEVTLTGGQLIVTNALTLIGSNGVGQVTISNGTWLAREVSVGSKAGSQGVLAIAGGISSLAGDLTIGVSQNSTGTVSLTGGQLIVTNNSTFVGEFGLGQMTVSGGTWRARDVAVGRSSGSSGVLTIIGGTNLLSSTLQVAQGQNSTGSVFLTGGQLVTTNINPTIGTLGSGQMTVSNGTWLVGSVVVGEAVGSQGTLTFADGTNTVDGLLILGDSANATGTVWVTGGGLASTNGTSLVGNFGVGQMTVSNATWFVGDVRVGFSDGGRGTLTIASGTSSMFSSLLVGRDTCTSTGIVAVTGGSLFVTNAAGNATLEVQSGMLTISGGSLHVDRIVLTNVCAHFARTSGSLVYGTAVLNPGEDTDGDGFSNQVEQDAGSDPLDPNSVPMGQLSVTPATLIFGTVATGMTAQASFVVTNTGAGSLSGGATVLGGPFAIISGSPFSLAANGSTNVFVQFAPVGAGGFTNTVVFDAGGDGISSNTVTGTGAVAPVAHFSATPTNGAAALLVNFTDASTGTITNRLWSFGDTGTSTLASPSHTYSNAGVFSVSLTVFGPVGSSMTNAANLITVTNVLPVAGFTAAPTNGAAPLLVMFTDTSTGTITNEFWTFGDGASSGGGAPTHTYTTAGVFSVSLTVSGPAGSDTLDQPDLITVTNVAPMAGFSASPTNGLAPLLVNFTDASTGTITNRLWDFGDGGSSTATSPSHTYTNIGSFSVALMVFGPTGTDSLTRPGLIVVTNAPVNADLEVIKLASPSPVSVASNLSYTITVTNRGPDTATSVTLTDALPASVSFVSASDECTNSAGLVVCDLGSLTSGAATNVTLVVVPTLEGSLTNVASVAAVEADPNPANNTVTNITQVFTVPPPPHDFAVVKLKAPKRIKLSEKAPSKVGKFKVTIQNLGPQPETIPDLAALEALVTVEVETLGTNCASFVATLVPPKKSFPMELAPNKKLNLSYQATFDCANDPAKTTKTEDHNDFETMATVSLSALGEVDTGVSNDTCPRPPNPETGDPGCGNKDKATKQLGAPVLTDVIVK